MDCMLVLDRGRPGTQPTAAHIDAVVTAGEMTADATRAQYPNPLTAKIIAVTMPQSVAKVSIVVSAM